MYHYNTYNKAKMFLTLSADVEINACSLRRTWFDFVINGFKTKKNDIIKTFLSITVSSYNQNNIPHNYQHATCYLLLPSS